MEVSTLEHETDTRHELYRFSLLDKNVNQTSSFRSKSDPCIEGYCTCNDRTYEESEELLSVLIFCCTDARKRATIFLD
jgi:hypothetical protein